MKNNSQKANAYKPSFPYQTKENSKLKENI
jgi:hypothetical protein